MIRRSFRIGLWVGLLTGITIALMRLFRGREAPIVTAPAPATSWPPLQPRPETPAPDKPEIDVVPPEDISEARPEPEPARQPAAAPAPAPAEASWIDPEEGACPETHPVKAKLSSRIFHLPGMFNYDRTIPDRCYVDAEAAEADGFRRSKR